MKTRLAEFICVTIVILVCLALAAASITWGLPSAERNALYFQTPESLKTHQTALKNEYIEESYKTFGNYQLKHPDESFARLPRSYYNPVRSYHPDEYLPIKMLSQFKPHSWDFDPKIYTLGGAYIYLLGLILFAAKALGIIQVSGDLSIYFAQPDLMATIFILGRLLTLAFFAGLLTFTYLTVRELANSGPALFATAALGTAPLVTLNARYMYVDIAALFYLAGALYFAIRAMRTPRPANFLFSGLFGGLAAGTKFQCILVAAIIWLAHLLAHSNRDKQQAFFTCRLRSAFLDKRILLAAASFAGAFIITNPYSIIKPRAFIFDLARHAPHRLIPGHYFNALLAGMGPVAFVVALAALVACIFLSDRRPALVGVWGLLFIGFMSRYGHFFARFALPAIPALFILPAAVSAILAHHWPKLRPLFLICAILILGWNVAWTCSLTNLLRGTDTRTEAGIWVKQHIPAGSSIGVVSEPWQYEMPPLDLTRYRIVVTNKDGDALSGKNPDWFIASSQQFAHDLHYPEGPAYQTFWRLLWETNYEPTLKINHLQSWGGIRFNQGHFPDDLRNYVNPEIIIFRRKTPVSVHQPAPR